MDDLTYVFEDGQVFTLHKGKVVTSVPEDQFAEPTGGSSGGPTELPPPPEDLHDDLGGPDESACPGCGSPTSPSDKFCANCGAPISAGPDFPDSNMYDQYPHNTPSPGIEMGGEAGPYQASRADQYTSRVATVTTPNGLTGRVLGKVAGLWGDQVTVRLENGNIVHLPVHKDFKFASEESVESDNPVETLNTRLAATAEGDVDSLKARAQELDEIKREATRLIEDASDEEAANLNEIIVTASYERQEVDDGIQHFAELEGQAYEPPAPFGINVVEQEAVGGADGSWLDQTLGEMVAEAESTDWGKVMQEGPEAFVAGLDEPALADAGTTRSIAARYIRSKTAAADPDVRGDYEKVWLARIEECRRVEAASRKQEVQRKEAAIQEEDYSDLPDEFGFGA